MVDVDRLPVKGEGDGDIRIKRLAIGKGRFEVANPEKDPLAGGGLEGQGPRQVGSTEMRKCACVGAAQWLRWARSGADARHSPTGTPKLSMSLVSADAGMATAAKAPARNSEEIKPLAPMTPSSRSPLAEPATNPVAIGLPEA